MLPTFNKRCLSAVFAAFAGLLAAAPAHAAPSAKVKAAFPVDSDHDGHVDAVSLKWSKKVKSRADTAAPFAFKVRGYRVTSVGSVRGKKQQLRVAERPECDTGGSVRLAFRPREGAVSIRGARKHKLDMRRLGVPTPRITCAVTLDSNSNGRIDGVRVTYSREVKSDAQTRGRFLFSVAGYSIKAVKAARGRFVEIDVAEHAVPDSGAHPAVGYLRPTKRKLRRYAVRVNKKTDAFSGSYQSTRDGVSPQLISGKTGDGDADGLLDAMTVRFSEPVTAAGSTGLAVLGMVVRPNAQVSGADVALSLVENTARGDALPGTWVAAPGITDLAGNSALHTAVWPSDGAAPVMTSAVTQDATGSAGRLDAVTVTFSEPIAHARDAYGRYPFLLGGRAVSSVEAASGRTVQVRIAEAAAPDTGERPGVRYLPGSGIPVTDSAGNEAVQGFVSAVDGVAPVLVSALTGDGDSDGKIGSLVFQFSEDVVHGAETPGSSFAVAGYSVTAAGAANDDEVALTLTEKPAADSGARPTVSYTRDGVEDVRDAAGNLTVSSSRTAGDGARPVLLTASTADVDDDGRLDRLASTWSEPLTHADDTSAPFAVSASGFSVSRVRAASGANLSIDLTEPSGYNTGSKPAVTYLGGSARIRDASGLEPAQKTWAGLTVDALDPRVISATTGDGDADGELDSIAVRFSESVVHAQEATPGSFTAGAFTISSAEAAVGDSVELKLLQSGTPDTGARPAVSYTPDGTEDVRDATGNFADAASIAQATDGARPALLSAATEDVDDNGRLDRLSTGWSEPLNHADDSTAPFPLSAEGFAVARVHAAVGQTLDIDLTEPAGADTGSAPDLTYASGADPIRDVAGLEPAQVAHSGLTRDALPPRRVSTATADTDVDGKLDAIEIEWSEDVTGATGTAPFTVAGRTLGLGATFDDEITRVPFVEDPAQYDTHDTPQVSYDDVAGDLHDVAEGTGDTTEDAPAVAAATPDDKARPVLVAAKTGDLSTPSVGNVPNGTIDAVLTTFSEPISHSVDAMSPFSLNVAGRTETSVEGDSGPGDRTLYVMVGEKPEPDGGETPNVSVLSVGLAADHIKDQALVPNEAEVMTFTGATDEVRPVLMSAQLGERPGGGGCTKDPVAGIDGQVDCVTTTWSEDVVHAGDADGTYSLSSSDWAIDGGISALGPSTTLELPLTVDTEPDRDRSNTTITYNSAVDEPVVDAAVPSNDALDGTVNAAAACKDTGREPNDAFNDTTHQALLPLSPAFERKCAFDDDWFRVTETASGHLEVSTRPVAGIDTKLALFDGGGALVLGGVEEDGAAGEVDRLTFSGLGAGTYWARVQADDSGTPQEGPYCLVYSNVLNEPASCGPLAGQIVFTEAGFGNDKFLEIKNDAEVPVEMQGASAKVVVGTGGTQRECWLVMPSVDDESILAPDEHVLIDDSNTADSFGCTTDDPTDPSDPIEPPVIASLDPAGERIEMFANGAIDTVPLQGVITSNVAAHHSLQFVETTVDEDHQANDLVVTRWCRTFAADTKGAAGDGCDEYRINEVLWRPTNMAASSDGRAFVEIAGNIPALASSELLGGWVVRGVNGLTGEGTSDFVLASTASPRSNGTYVIADGVAGVTQVSQKDVIWDSLDLNSTSWPTACAAPPSPCPPPRGLQLLRPDPPSSPPCPGSVDAFGWTTTAQGFSTPFDDLRSCPGLEGQEYTTSTVGASAARDNLSSAGDTTYNASNDTTNNKIDFCPQTTPNPASLNIRPNC